MGTEVFDEWTQPQARLEESREWIESLGIGHLRVELTRPDIDAAAASCMLKSAVEELQGRGVEGTKLISKLRRDPAVWPTVTELISVNAIAKLYAPEATVQLDGGDSKPGSPRPDLRLGFRESGQSLSVEFKAIGLSTEEVALFQKAAAVLPDKVPSFGVANPCTSRLKPASRSMRRRGTSAGSKSLRTAGTKSGSLRTFVISTRPP